MLLCPDAVWAQTQTPAADQATANAPQKDRPNEGKSFGDVLLKLGKGLMKEVSRRLNLEETEIITVRKEVTADGGYKYHVDTGKFQFDIKKKQKPPKPK